MKFKNKIILSLLLIFINNPILSYEMIIGEEKISPGIDITFEAAIKDEIKPKKYFLDQDATDVHLEVLINWNKDAPEGSPEGGFIPYLKVKAVITNLRNNIKEEFLLTPHINLVDNYHYASNIKLSGKISDNYNIEFFISPPGEGELGYHYDWVNRVNYPIIQPFSYLFKNLNFKKIINLKRR
tara:strand:+ start:1049 stop:1597 length:549 start_codon:yes stop_codon:yes gene_type:complete